MQKESIYKATLLSIAMAIVSAGTVIVEKSLVGGIVLIILGGILPFGREYLKEIKK